MTLTIVNDSNNIQVNTGNSVGATQGFSTRTAFVASIAGNTPLVGTVVSAAGYFYRFIGYVTGVISDLAGWVPQGPSYPDHWGENITPGTTNMSAAIASAWAYSDTIYLSSFVYGCKEVLRNSYKYMFGSGRNTGGLRLLNNANTFLLADSVWANNETGANLWGGFQNVKFDGNKANNPTGTLLHFRSFRLTVINCGIFDSGKWGIEHTAVGRDGKTLSTASFSDCVYSSNDFRGNTRGHWAGLDKSTIVGDMGEPSGTFANKVADFVVADNTISQGGETGWAQIYCERFTGGSIIGNKMFNTAYHNIYVDKVSGGRIIGNKIGVGTGVIGTAGDLVAGIVIDTYSTNGGLSMTDNVTVVQFTADSATFRLRGLWLKNNSNSDGIILGPNSYTDTSAALLALPYQIDFSIDDTKLTGCVWPQDAIDMSGFVMGVNHFPHAAWRPQSRDAAGFMLPSLTTTDRDLLPSPSNGQFHYNSTLNQFEGRDSNEWATFINSSGGNIIGSSFYFNNSTDPTSNFRLTTAPGLGSRTLTAPATGGEIIVASGAQTFTTQKTFSAGAKLEDGSTLFYGNLDNTKLAKFEVDGLTPGTTRTMTIPDASGTLALDLGVFAAGGTVNALAFASQYDVNQTPASDRTYTTTIPPINKRCTLVITTTGTISRTLTFSTGFLNSAVLNTGTVSGKFFVLTFVSTGTGLVEMSRVGPI